MIRWSMERHDLEVCFHVRHILSTGMYLPSDVVVWGLRPWACLRVGRTVEEKEKKKRLAVTRGQRVPRQNQPELTVGVRGCWLTRAVASRIGKDVLAAVASIREKMR